MESNVERIHRAYIALRRFTADDPKMGNSREWVPAWSSFLLEKTLEEILSQPGGQLSDVFHALWDLEGGNDVSLTKTMANFIHDIVVYCFIRHRTKYDIEDFKWMADKVQEDAAPAQAYLALLALPERFTAESKDAILLGLEGTLFLDEARKML